MTFALGFRRVKILCFYISAWHGMSLGRPFENNNGFPRLYFDSFIGLRNIKT